MIDQAAIAALVVVAGAIWAVSARDGRAAVLGLLAALVAAPLVAAPSQASLGVAARILGGLLAAYLLWVAARPTAEAPLGVGGSATGAAAQALVALAAFAVGLQPSLVERLAGPAAAQASGFAVIVLAVPPLLGRDLLRLGVGALLLALGGALLRTSWGGPSQPLEQLALAGLMAGIAGATAALLTAPRESPAAQPARRKRASVRAPDPGPAPEPALEPVLQPATQPAFAPGGTLFELTADETPPVAAVADTPRRRPRRRAPAGGERA